MPDPAHPELSEIDLPTVLAALADPVRLAIVRYAAAHPDRPCKEFLKNVPKSTASHHWKVLREAGLIRQTADGVTRRNALRREELDKRFPGLLDAVLSDASASGAQESR